MPAVLLVGESWFTHTVHQKGFDAFHTSEYTEGAGAFLQALRERGLSVPSDVSVVGFDDVRAAALTDPGLTTIRQPAYDVGRTAATQLLQYVARGEVPPASRHLLAVSITVRGSTARVPARVRT